MLKLSNRNPLYIILGVRHPLESNSNRLLIRLLLLASNTIILYTIFLPPSQFPDLAKLHLCSCSLLDFLGTTRPPFSWPLSGSSLSSFLRIGLWPLVLWPLMKFIFTDCTPISLYSSLSNFRFLNSYHSLPVQLRYTQYRRGQIVFSNILIVRSLQYNPVVYNIVIWQRTCLIVLNNRILLKVIERISAKGRINFRKSLLSTLNNNMSSPRLNGAASNDGRNDFDFDVVYFFFLGE